MTQHTLFILNPLLLKGYCLDRRLALLMNDESQQNKNNPFLLQSIVFIALETYFTLVLKHDRMTRLHAQPFIKLGTCLHVHTFLPSDIFFVSFDRRGLLFDHETPQSDSYPKITLYASGLDLIRAFLTGNERSISKIQLSGEEHLHDALRLLFLSMSLPAVLRDWKNWLFRDQKTTQLPKNSVAPLLQRIEQQRKEITDLTIKVKEQAYDLQALQKRHRMMSRLYGLVIFLLSILIAAILWYNYL